MNFVNILAGEFKLRPQQVQAAVELLDAGNTIPFIARYRKEATGSLDDQVLRELAERLEYLHRLSEQKRLLELLPGEIPLLPCGYDNAAFEAFAPAMADAPEGGERCLACFALRLDYTAAQAKEHGFEYFTTTLSVSPHKNADNVNRIGEEAGKKHGVKYLFADFKKKNGYLRSLELSKEYGLYRQDYCGCRYSMNHDQAD